MTERVFHIEACLGRGGFGEVYRARMTRPGGFETLVAVKVLRPDVAPDGQAVERLQDEARMLGLLRHRAIPRVMDFVTLDGRLALVGEYVEGADLSRCLRRTPPMGTRALAEVIATVADALDAAWHATGPRGGAACIVHRDLKPANIRIGRDGAARLLDFGIAWTDRLDRAADTQTAALVGSPAYMAPERFDGASPSAPNDVFGLGAVLYEALSGTRLFGDLAFKDMAALSVFEDRYARSVDERMGLVPDDVHPDLRALLRSMVGWAPHGRPSAAEVSASLEQLGPHLDGPTLGTWCRGQPWRDDVRDGPWVGRRVTEGVMPLLDDTATHDAVPEVTQPRFEITQENDLPSVSLESLTTLHRSRPASRRIALAAAVAGAMLGLTLGASRLTVVPAVEGMDDAAGPAAAIVETPPSAPEMAPPTPTDPATAEPEADAPRPDAEDPELEAEPSPAARPAVGRKATPRPPTRVAEATAMPDVGSLLGEDGDVGDVAARPEPSGTPDPTPTTLSRPPAPNRQVASTAEVPPPSPAPPAKPPSAQVLLDGASAHLDVLLRGDAGTHRLPADVPPGKYTIVAAFDPGFPRAAGTLEVRGDDRVAVRCARGLCRVVP